MKSFVLYLSLCVFHTLVLSDAKREVSIRVSPSRSQFLQYESVSLSCEVSAGGGRLKRNTTSRGTESCPYSWGNLDRSTCTIDTLYPSDTGFYWCESSSGAQSEVVHIKVTGGSVILESPVLPVMEGDAVTLRCTNRKSSSSSPTADFYKDGLLIRSSSTGNMTIHSVSESDEGLYMCNISGAGQSPDSWLEVRVSDSARSGSPAAPVMSVSRLICHVFVGSPYLLSTILLGLIYRDNRRASQRVAEDRGHNVIIEVD
ncbi:low affinity immunoglobulin gamma Fc region receptor III-like isoform X2 [Chelmon rostratus]|uniref:low affinity immunoglobulin gamma Fc region receptor III-like isoform X2 n=1 Tax=Chelmon rostratus TaxID=109905 RepID=UPI001BE8E996|nr:low affinity immunoglobulin gamma Fc region receptor III-like isoform X2 [Chelmon rostratus]